MTTFPRIGWDCRARLSCLLLTCLAVGGCSGSQAQPATPSTAPRPSFSIIPGVSGMAAVNERTYLFIHDARTPNEPRAGLWRLDRLPPAYEVVPIDDEDLGDERLADLESVAAVPGQPLRFMLLESGTAGKPEHRRALAYVELIEEPMPRLKLLGWKDLWPVTSRLGNCESIVCWRNDDQLFVMIADRASSTPGRSRFAVVCGRLNLSANGALDIDVEAPQLSKAVTFIDSPAPASKSWRACTDLYLDDQRQLWGASAEDRGDAGPFRSMVYRVGVLNLANAQILPDRTGAVYQCAGVKIEALARGSIAGAAICFGSDDERYGGIWRPLPAAGEISAAGQH